MADADCTRTHICAHCGTRFTGRKRRYCSDQCAHDHREAYAANERREIKTAGCHGCGERFEYLSKPGSPPRYCGPQCKPGAPVGTSEKHCAECGEVYEGRANTTYCSKGCRSKARGKRRYLIAKKRGTHKRAIGEADCLECGAKFRVYHNTKGMFCSKSCSVKHRNADPEWKAKDDVKRARRSNRQWLSRNQGAFSPVMDATCLHCQKVHTKSQGAGRFCSVECREADAEQNKKWNIRMTHDLPLTQIKICPETGWLFKPENNSEIYATREIGHKVHKRIAKAKRRARKKNNGRMENIDPLEVFRSVDYVCQICGCQTEEDKRGTIHDRAPQLDHIIPLAQGGTHTWGNVQCACRACNITKSDSLPKKHRADQRLLAL